MREITTPVGAVPIEIPTAPSSGRSAIEIYGTPPREVFGKGRSVSDVIDAEERTMLHKTITETQFSRAGLILINLCITKDNINKKDSYGNTPLHYFMQHCDNDMAKFKRKEIDGESIKESCNILRMLLSNGANPNTKNNQGLKPIDLIKDQKAKVQIQKDMSTIMESCFSTSSRSSGLFAQKYGSSSYTKAR